MSTFETVLALGLSLLLAYFAFSAVGDDFPLNVAVGVLGFVVAVVVLFSVGRRDGN